jgi:hypothetical protein
MRRHCTEIYSIGCRTPREGEQLLGITSTKPACVALSAATFDSEKER